jgi:hypothetical protein
LIKDQINFLIADAEARSHFAAAKSIRLNFALIDVINITAFIVMHHITLRQPRASPYAVTIVELLEP